MPHSVPGRVENWRARDGGGSAFGHQLFLQDMPELMRRKRTARSPRIRRPAEVRPRPRSPCVAIVHII